MNPYLIPGFEDTPIAPLSPLNNKDHHTFYVAVDDTETEFRRFQDTMRSVGRLMEEGRLVVVTGKPGCGKTSLINRCAAWLRDELAEVESTAVIIPLTRSAKLDDPITHRMEQVITDVIDHLSNEQHEVRAQDIELLRRKIREIQETTRIRSVIGREDRQKQLIAQVDRVYKYIMQEALPDDRIAIILLPPSSELVNEITHYADFARYPRIVFFAETDYVDDVRRMWPRISTNDRRTPILLKVGPLNTGDGWTYAQARQGINSAGRNFPTVTEETMRRVTEGNVVSIRRLHWLLYSVYKNLASQNTSNDSSPLREVSFDRIAQHFFQLEFGESSGNMS
ncbi:MAG: hypothetical protein ACRDRA_00250 [Pseudonocardiaceae bacterium]